MKVALHDNLQICAGDIYCGHLSSSSIPENVFLEFMHVTTEGAEFSFNIIMSVPIDGVSMGSLMRPVLANIFVGFHENLLFEKTPHSISSVFNSIEEAVAFSLQIILIQAISLAHFGE